MKDFLGKLYERLETKMSDQLGYRGDLFVADHQTINANTAKLLIGYNKSLNQPTVSDVSKFIVKAFGGKITPKLETARIYPTTGAVALIVGKIRVTRAFADRKNMLAVSSTLFLDQQIGDKWEVQKEGSKTYLARIDSENIEEIVAQRMQKMQLKASVMTFANIQQEQCLASAQAGDTVKFFYDGNEHTGQIISIGPVKATIKTRGGNIAVDPAAIFEIVKVSRESQKNTADALRKYYENAYPGKYGDMYLDLYKK